MWEHYPSLAPIYNGDVSIIGLMPQIVSLADTGSNPAHHPKFNGLIVYECNRILDSQSGELGLTPSEATNFNYPIV